MAEGSIPSSSAVILGLLTSSTSNHSIDSRVGRERYRSRAVNSASYIDYGGSTPSLRTLDIIVDRDLLF